MAAQRSVAINSVLEREARQSSAMRSQNNGTSSSSRLNAAWRQKVIHWYFTLVAALRRQHSASAVDVVAGNASGNDGSLSRAANPFNRTMVHLSASLLDNYLLSLSSEQALRYKHDRPAYQLLATTCLLLGMRLAGQQKHTDRESGQQDARDEEEHRVGGLKRAKTLRTNMMAAGEDASSTTTTTSMSLLDDMLCPDAAIPTVATILRISAAPRSISEQNIRDMIKQLTLSRVFKSQVVTALDYIYALSSTSTNVSQDGLSISLGGRDLEVALRLADALLNDVNTLSSRPSAVASAVITHTLVRSNCSEVANLDMSAIRQKVYYSIYGSKDIGPDLQVETLKAEATIQVGVPASRQNAARRVLPTTHLIPIMDDE